MMQSARHKRKEQTLRENLGDHYAVLSEFRLAASREQGRAVCRSQDAGALEISQLTGQLCRQVTRKHFELLKCTLKRTWVVATHEKRALGHCGSRK